MLLATALARLILFAAIAWVTLRHYRHTRNPGFLIIGCGVLIWPLLGSLVVSLVAYFMLGRNLWLELVVDRTGQVIGAGLILAGLIAIQRSINSVGHGVHRSL
jgi:hypothetical protein